MDPTLNELEDIKTAVSEAVTNAIIHGYRGTDGVVTMTATYENNNLEIIVRDKGVGIADVRQALEPFYTTQPELERSGMGFSVMETFMDGLQVASAPGKGTRVKMQKRICPPA